jgi:hypothetical protein
LPARSESPSFGSPWEGWRSTCWYPISGSRKPSAPCRTPGRGCARSDRRAQDLHL